MPTTTTAVRMEAAHPIRTSASVTTGCSRAAVGSRYLYVDIRIADVGSGFKLRAITTTNVQIDGPQITADYASGGAHDYKRVAIPLPAGVTAADIITSCSTPRGVNTAGPGGLPYVCKGGQVVIPK